MGVFVRLVEVRKRIFFDISSIFNDFIGIFNGFRFLVNEIYILIDLLSDMFFVWLFIGLYIFLEVLNIFVDVGLVKFFICIFEVLDLDNVEFFKIVIGIIKVLELVIKEYVYFVDSNSKNENVNKLFD